mmetsp:Transcript_9793/g.14399  ORF Transcript_9793/g.14399 Transcript_9793/m.14399 type:complete len:210 (+) Transcript_9793:69-698(+)
MLSTRSKFSRQPIINLGKVTNRFTIAFNSSSFYNCLTILWGLRYMVVTICFDQTSSSSSILFQHSSNLQSPFPSRPTMDPLKHRHSGAASSSSSSPETEHSSNLQVPLSSRPTIEPSKHRQTGSSPSVVGRGFGERVGARVGGRVGTMVELSHSLNLQSPFSSRSTIVPSKHRQVALPSSAVGGGEITSTGEKVGSPGATGGKVKVGTG